MIPVARVRQTIQKDVSFRCPTCVSSLDMYDTRSSDLSILQLRKSVYEYT